MATSKTLTPTNVTIYIPEFTDQPDQRVNSNCIDKEADAINSLAALKTVKHTTYTMETSSDTARLDNKGLGVTATNFLRAIVTSANNITVLPHTYSGYLYVSFYNKSTMATVSGTYTMDILYGG